MSPFAPPRELYPFASREIEVRPGVVMRYLDEGSGPLVVMVHGNPSWSLYYRNLVLALRPDHRCLVPDHIGCGLSDKPGDARYDYTLRSRVDDLERLIETAAPGPEPITLVLHDWGGAIGMGYAARHTERVGRLVILNTGAFFNPKGERLPLTLRLVRDTPLGPLLVRGLNAFSLGATHMATVRPMSRELRRAYTGPYGSWADRIATLRFVQDIPLKPADPAWSEIERIDAGLAAFASVPALIAWGLKDFVFDDSFLAEWRRRMPQAEVHAFDDVGHYTLEDGGDRIFPLVRDFLARTTPAPPGAAAGAMGTAP